jgi:hypothetical protein
MFKHTLQNPILELWSFGLKCLVRALLQLSPKHQLWIVEPDGVR